MKLVKLGGSVITYKGRRKRFRRKVMERLGRELAPFGDALCLVHGGGSYGHPLASRHGLHQGLRGSDALRGFAEVHRQMQTLNGLVTEALQAHEIAAVSLPPAPLVSVKDGRLVAFQGAPFQAYLKVGFVPVTFGDVVLDAARGSAIVSGDDLMLHLARVLHPEVALFVTDVEGVLDAEGSLVPVLSDVPPLAPLEEDVDVTGGLRGKLHRMLEIVQGGTPCRLVSGLVPGRVRAALEGREVPGTSVVADGETLAD